MNGNEFAPNSNRSKAEQKAAKERKFEKIVQGPVKVKKKSGFRKMTDSIIAGDGTTIKTHIKDDVIIPNIKKIIWEVLTGGLDIALNGKNGSYRNTKPSGPKMSYNSCYGGNRPIADNSAKAKGGYSCDDIVFASRGEAEEVLSQLIEGLEEYETPVSVMELYSMVGLPHTPTDCKWGWKDLSNAYVERRTDGYMLRLPRPVAITD